MRREHDVVGAELGARDLEDHVRDALADLGRGAVHLRAPVRAQPHARSAVVVEALRVADVLEADREADAAPDALAAGRVPGAAGEPDRVARELLGLGYRKLRRTPDHLGDGERPVDPLAGRQDVAGRERVPEAELDRVDLERDGELVHLRLGREARLHGAEAAHRAAGRVVRVDAGRLEQSVRDRVRPARERRRVRCHGGRARRVRAAVEEDPHADADEAPVAVRPVLGPDPRRVTVHVPDERLLARVDHLHRPARVQREQRAVDLHREVLAAAERAADAGEVDPHLLGLEVEARRDLVAVDVQPLRRDVDVDTALAVRHRQSRLRAEEGLVLDPELVLAGDRDVAGGVGVAVADHEPADDVRARIVAVAVPVRPRWSWIGSCSSARSGSTTGSSGSYSTRIRSAARRACSGCSAATSATGSPK